MHLLKVIFFVLFFSMSSYSSFSDEIGVEKYRIEGNKRIPTSYISNLVKDLLGKKVTNKEINSLTKTLYLSDFFDDVKITTKENLLIIKVIEKPIINEIIFEGNDFLEDKDLEEVINIKKRETFSEKKLSVALKKIREEYSRSGRYRAKIDVRKQDLPQSRIKLIFVINEGDPVKVNKINFVGNKFFSDDDLRSVITTKEASLIRVFGSSIFRKENIELDKAKLLKFYNTRGYVDFRVVSYRTDLLPDYSGFNLNIIVSEGLRYKIKKINFDNNVLKLDEKKIKKSLTVNEGDYYDMRAVRESVSILNETIGSEGYSFVKIETSLNNKNKGFLDLTFKINEGQKSYIGLINISGNTRTLDYVIRRELKLLEGDPFNAQKLKESIQAIRRLGYFTSVDVDLKETSTPNQVDINIMVKETLTGDFAFGIGYDSVEKEQITIGLNEKNFLGKGLKTRFNVSTSAKSTKYDLGITEPYFRDKPLLLSGNIFDQTNERGDRDIDKTGMSFAFGFDVKEYFNKFSYSFVESKTTTSSSSTASSVSGEEGIEVQTSSLNYTIVNDTRDNYFNPKSGYRFLFDSSLAGIGGDAKFAQIQTKYKSYTPFSYGDHVLSFSGNIGFTSAIDDEKITSSNRFYFNSKKVRGFDSGGMGPRDTGNDQAVGGNNYYSGSLELRTKSFMPEDTGIEWSIFSDFGSLWDTDYPDNVRGVNDSSPRVSSGVALYWTTPIGPLNFIWGWPVSKESYDKENNFKFSIGTSF